MVATLIVNDEDAQDMMMLGERAKKNIPGGGYQDRDADIG